MEGAGADSLMVCSSKQDERASCRRGAGVRKRPRAVEGRAGSGGKAAGDASGENEEARAAGLGDEMQQEQQQMAAGCRDGKGEKWRREQKSGRPQLMTEKE